MKDDGSGVSGSETISGRFTDVSSPDATRITVGVIVGGWFCVASTWIGRVSDAEDADSSPSRPSKTSTFTKVLPT